MGYLLIKTNELGTIKIKPNEIHSMKYHECHAEHKVEIDTGNEYSGGRFNVSISIEDAIVLSKLSKTPINDFEILETNDDLKDTLRNATKKERDEIIEDFENKSDEEKEIIYNVIQEINEEEINEITNELSGSDSPDEVEEYDGDIDERTDIDVMYDDDEDERGDNEEDEDERHEDFGDDQTHYILEKVIKELEGPTIETESTGIDEEGFERFRIRR